VDTVYNKIMDMRLVCLGVSGLSAAVAGTHCS